MIEKGTKTERISYAELARRVGDTVLNNTIMSQTQTDGYYFDLENGADTYCYKHETEEECAKDDSNCDYESVEVYQTYIISGNSADYLERNTDEIIYYCDKLDIYLWGITHFGTGWDYVHTSVKAY